MSAGRDLAVALPQLWSSLPVGVEGVEGLPHPGGAGWQRGHSLADGEPRGNTSTLIL